MSLEDLRRRLDALDNQLLELLRQRASIAEQVGDFKRGLGAPYHQPHREREVLNHVAEADLGQFPPAAAQAIFREIIAACRTLQQAVRIAYLGPAGTFTEMAARQLYGQANEYLPARDFAEVFAAVARGDAEHGVVPVENSTAGTIREVLDLLATASLTIVGETNVDIHHCLLSKAELSAIRVVYSKDSALQQCRQWLEVNLPKARLVPVASTAGGAARAAETATGAAIAPELAAQVYELPIRARNIEDRCDNRTRFFALGHETPAPSGCDKTSLLISVSHRPGALVEALGVLREHDLNMTLIESRPSPYAAFEYLFFIDFEGHCQTPKVARAIDDLGRACMLTQVLGSYPRAGS